MSGEYYKTKESVEEYIKMAEGIYGRNLITKLQKHLRIGSSLLEIGSGPGSDFKILKESYQVTGSDFSDEFINRLKRIFKNDSFLNLDAATLETDICFDGIYSNKVFQHLSNDQIKQSVNRQSKILNSEGIICHSFWKGEGEEIFKGMLVNYQNEESLINLFGNAFEILLIEDYKEFEDGDSILFIGMKK